MEYAGQSPGGAGADNGQDLVARFGQLESRRGNWNSHWQEVAEFALPSYGDFNVQQTSGGKRHQKIYDDTAPRGLSRFAAAAQSFIAPPNSRYQRLAPKHKEVLEIEGVPAYYDDLTDALYAARHAPRAQFQTFLVQTLLQVGAFGNGPGFVDADPKGGLIYTGLPLAQTYCDLDPWGRLDGWWRKFPLTARQAEILFGLAALPPKIQKCLERDAAGKIKAPDTEFQFLHCVYANREIAAGHGGFQGMAHASRYVSIEGAMLVKRGGYRTMPYIMARYETNAGETYGRGPCMNVLPSIKLVNAMARSGLHAAELAALPPLLLADDALDVFKLAPSALNYGTLDLQGRPLVQALQMGGQPQHMLAQQQDARKAILDALLVSLFDILVEAPRMSATQAAYRNQERGILIGPLLSRLNGDIFDAMTGRELDILDMQGALPAPPPRLLEKAAELNALGKIASARAVMEYEEVYVSPAQQAIKAGDVINVMQFIEATVKLATVDPTATRSLNVPEIQRILADGMFVPARIVRGEAELEEMRQADAEAQQAAQVLGGASAGAAAIKDLALSRKAGAEAAVIEGGGAQPLADAGL